MADNLKYNLPILYNPLSPKERKEVREQYIKQQNGRCMYCNNLLTEEPPIGIGNMFITWELFPTGFRQSPIHLQHCHKTGYTEGAVHMKCNAVLWQYEGR